ncbi:hypothetical protein GE061_004553 [Apolygus lucorum]|uniref:Uncharacterized protein n=1 Tax=Apolygus lucorum TaxID=248454 RepID=A0A6A4IVS4_APOLU|nr:hypothetical protein GE061_004553 [Apolygus lucorum]
MGSGSVVNFDLSSEGPNNYFKSSFARSMAFSNTSQSKSLDYVYLDEGKTISEELTTGDAASGVKSPGDASSLCVTSSGEPLDSSTPRKAAPRRSVPALPTFEPGFPREYSASVRLSRSRPNGTTDPIKFWKMKQEAASKQSESQPQSFSGEDSTLLQEESKDDEILRLRKKDNRWRELICLPPDVLGWGEDAWLQLRLKQHLRVAQTLTNASMGKLSDSTSLEGVCNRLLLIWNLPKRANY